jgi:long-chain acyl-CoA synthetase
MRDIFIDRLKMRATHHASEPAYYTRTNHKWEAISWGDYYRKVASFAKSLISLGLPKNGKVAILGFNRVEWAISCMGAQTAGCVSVGIYTSSSAEEVAYVVDHSDAEVLIVENYERYVKQVLPIKSKLSKVKTFVIMESFNESANLVLDFNEFLHLGNKINDVDLEARSLSVEPQDVATMIYTSGTTGSPKSVMLSHASIAWTIRSLVASFKCNSQDKSLSYLPLAHIAEQAFTIYAPVECGMQSCFATSFEELKDNLREVEPTIFFGVPRVYEKMYDAINVQMQKKKSFEKFLLKYFAKISEKTVENLNSNISSGFLLSQQMQLGRRLIFNQIRKKMGFGRIRVLVCGAAPISKSILHFFSGLDMPIYEVYGQSEDTGPTSINYPGSAKIGSAGRPLIGSQIKIAADGEILVKGPHVFLGYYKDEAATKETLRDGWLMSGDIGMIDKQGFLFITDRKKELLITAGGKNVAPQGIEAMLKSLPFVQSAVVVGDSKKYLSALFAPDMERLKRKAVELGLDQSQASALLADPAILSAIADELAKINGKLAPVEQIKKYAFLNQEFSIDSGEFTPTMKLKRKFVTNKYREEIEGMYLQAS